MGMRWGILNLFCPICGVLFQWNQNVIRDTHRHKELGVVCSKKCLEKAELKYARMILGKDD